MVGAQWPSMGAFQLSPISPVAVSSSLTPLLVTGPAPCGAPLETGKMEPLTVTVAGARQALGIGTTKIYELIGDGQLRTIKIGRRTLIRTDSIYALVEDLAA
jgi:excisionase family DNA binding protein